MSAASARLLAVDPHGLGGIVLRGPSGPAREAWLEGLRTLILPRDTGEGDHAQHGGGSGGRRDLSKGAPAIGAGAAATPSTAFGGPPPPFRRLPPGVDEGRLLGGLDLVATLAAGRPVAAPGLLADADGGVLVVSSAERLGRATAAHLCAALDTGIVVTERDGTAARTPARFAAILLDEGQDDERPPAALAERLAFAVNLEKGEPIAIETGDHDLVATARALLPRVRVPDDVCEALCATGLALGVDSLRVAGFAMRATKAAAALAGRDVALAADAELAAALVLAPRATRLPAEPETAPDAEAESPPAENPDKPLTQAPQDEAPPPDPTPPGDAKPLADSVAEAARAAIPADLLAALALAAGGAPRAQPGGRGGPPRMATRGRPVGSRRGSPGGGARLALVDTLRAAAPWQALRRRALPPGEAGRVLVRREDFRVARFKARTGTVTIVCVDASGSAALHRLAEAKGAVELILADCYVRRDEVALIAFRGAGASVVLPPTRSLARAKRALGGQTGGGGTPLAAGIEATTLLADTVRRKGQVALVVMMTDGKANIGRDGRPGRAAADGDAQAAAALFRAGGTAAMVLDIAPRPSEPARRLAAAMGAAYIPLPYADAGTVSRAAIAARPTG